MVNIKIMADNKIRHSGFISNLVRKLTAPKPIPWCEVQQYDIEQRMARIRANTSNDFGNLKPLINLYANRRG
jgi:hypothetical protein